ncbi:MAG: asparagine synthase-related protein, partial [Candidatus Heimdallarchaeota archaeon]|nr:asparagine synthase-related protein [Candidatus Heimdallarchaeota archaeon]
FGWFGPATSATTGKDIAKNMFAAVMEKTGELNGEMTADFALYAYGDDAAFACCKDSGVYVAVAGTINTEKNANSSHTDKAARLINIYKNAGEKFLSLLGGDFSLVIIDKTRQVIFIAIDKLGIKSLAYSELPSGGLVFGTTLDSVVAHPLVKDEISLQAVYNYTYFHVIPSPQTIYSNIKKLEPAHYLYSKNGKFTAVKYWSPDFYENNSCDEQSLKKELLTRLRSIAGKYDINDRSGSFLSGGLDSSTVSGILSERSDQPLKSFSIGFEEDGYDEILYARTAAKHFGLNHFEYYINPNDIINALPLVAKNYDEPFGNSSAIPTYVCAKFSAEHGIDTMYAGDGGDEIFAGNERYAKQKIFSYYDLIPTWGKEYVLEPFFSSKICNKTFITRKISRYIEQASLPMPNRMQSYNFLNMVNPGTVFNNEFFESIDPEFPAHLMADTYQSSNAKTMLNKMLYLDWKFTLADNDLRKVNRMTELAGVKVIYPMLDDELVEFSTRIPPKLKLKGMDLRYFFKDGLKDFLPEKILNKQKHGFGLPFGEWLKKSPQLQDTVYDSLNNLAKRDIYRKEFIDDLIKNHREGHSAYYGTMVWVLSMLEQWFYHHKR